jgi:DNA polymerase-3 subunit delta|tara:strand:+ start:807 stop:1841 length:1035 start_codon:yes stop_codon:yes gene_type:complete
MRLRANQLDTELKKSLLPIYFVTGDEPLLIQEALDSIRLACKQQGYDERKILEVDRKFNWQSLVEESNTLSLFSEKILTELRLGSSKPGVPGGKALQTYCKTLPEDRVLLISANKIDAGTLKTKWCSEIDRVGAIIQIWPISLNEMPQWLGLRSRKMGLKIEHDAIQLLADRLEGNLLAAQQELEKLRLLYPDLSEEIDTERVLQSVSDASKYDVFNLTDACLNGDAKLCAKIMSSLKLEGLEVSIVLWALSKEIRLLAALVRANLKGMNLQTVFKEQRVIQKRQPQLSQAARRLSLTRLQQLLDQCKLVDDLIKGAQKGIDPWDILNDVAFGIAGVVLPNIEY